MVGCRTHPTIFAFKDIWFDLFGKPKLHFHVILASLGRECR